MNHRQLRALVLASSCLVLQSVSASSGFELRYEGVASVDARVRLTVRSDGGGERFDQSVNVGGRTAGEARDEIERALRSAGWLVAPRGDRGLWVFSHRAAESGDYAVTELGVSHGDEGIDTELVSTIDWRRPAEDERRVVLRFTGEATSATRPGEALFSVRGIGSVGAPLPASARPAECAETLRAALVEAGWVASVSGSDVILELEDNQARFGETSSIVFGLAGATDGPRTSLPLPGPHDCDRDFVFGFALENVRGGRPFDRFIGAAADDFTCRGAALDVETSEARLWASIASRGTFGDGGPASGVQSWTVSIVAHGGEVIAFSREGTASDAAPSGLVGVGFVEFETAESAEEDGLHGLVGVVQLSLLMPVTLPPAGTESFLSLTVAPDAGETSEVILRYADGLLRDDDRRRNRVTVAREDHAPGLGGALVLRFPDDEARGFLRGDTNLDGDIELTDGVAILNHLFRGLVIGSCLDAADADDSGRLELTDAITIFAHLFQQAPPLPAPNECGIDPTSDELDCEMPGSCG